MTAANCASAREGCFDHIVLNLHYQLDQGESLLHSLGFTVTPRGYHSLGSMNHAIMFRDNYLELIGIDPNNPQPRKELLEWPVGLNGLVYGSDNIDATRARLVSQGLPALEAKTFGRPIAVGDRQAEARFRTAHLARSFFPPARLYFCEHLTRDLVWQDAFLHHPNTAIAINRVYVAADDPAVHANSLANALGVVPEKPPAPRPGAVTSEELTIRSGGISVKFLSPTALQALYPGSVNVKAQLPYVAGISVQVQSLDTARKHLHPRWGDVLQLADSRHLVIPAAHCFGAMIEFIEPEV